MLVVLVVKALDGRFPNHAVHPLDLTVGLRMVRLGKSVLNVICFADHVKGHLARPGGVAVAWLIGELHAVVGQDRVNAVGHGFQQVFQELPRCPSISRVDELSDRELAGAVDADEQVEPFDKLVCGQCYIHQVRERGGHPAQAADVGPFDRLVVKDRS